LAGRQKANCSDQPADSGIAGASSRSAYPVHCFDWGMVLARDLLEDFENLTKKQLLVSLVKGSG
jgi:hypothetical protein